VIRRAACTAPEAAAGIAVPRWPAVRTVAVTLLLTLAMMAMPGGPAVAAAMDEETLERSVSAAGAVLWDPLDRRVLWGRDARVPRRMASTTKIMTTLLALEADTLDDTVTVSTTAAAADSQPGAASLGLRAGQRIAMGDLLTALMLRSGNDAAVAVAEHVAGSEAAFVDQMNAAARRLGLDATQFINASGLTNSPEHHASPRDLALLAHEAMAHDAFAQIAGTTRAKVAGVGLLESRNLLLTTYEGATGIKTGYTALAGLCLVASATRDGRDLYAVVLDSTDSFADATALLDLGYDAFTVTSAAGAVAEVYRTAWGEIGLETDTTARTVPVDAKVRTRTVLVPTPPAQTTAGTVLGRTDLMVDGRVRARSPVRATGPVPDEPAVTPDTAAGAAIQDAIRAFVRTAPQRRPVPEGSERIVRQAARS
jgi:serine-type D-Ala-D-Ala carboxypeptidase (penicillin-binding protein 5/6)